MDVERRKGVKVGVERRGEGKKNGTAGCLKYMKEYYKIHLVHPWGNLCAWKQRERRET